MATTILPALPTESEQQIGESGSSNKKPRSLTISSNLDALLEYDSKIRGVWSKSSPTNSESTGLPPPPRQNPRKPKSPTSPMVRSPLAQSPPWTRDGIDVWNPFINPAPTLDVVVETGADPSCEEKPCGDLGSGPGSADESPSRRPSSVELQQPFCISQPSQLSKNRVDRLLGIGKRPLSLIPKTHSEPKVQLDDVSNSSIDKVLNRPNLRERARAKGKLLKLKDPAAVIDNSKSSQLPQMRQIDDRSVLDVRRRSVDSMTSDQATPFDLVNDRRLHPQRPPLLLHDLQFSSRRSSNSSSASSTTYGPASTIDPRISISSTIYPASSAHSHPHDMYQSVDPIPTVPPLRSSSLHQASLPNNTLVIDDPQSFIDINSPDIPEFNLVPLRSPQTRSQPPTRTSSPKPVKPPIPTAPKPNFNRLPKKISPPTCSKEAKQVSDVLSPTTNFLDLEERADLIRKNRKLAQVFGQYLDQQTLSQQSERNSKPPVLPPIPSGDNHHQQRTSSLSSNFEVVNSDAAWFPVPVSGERRHSAPLGHDGFLNEKHPSKISRPSDTDTHAPNEIGVSSPTSFIDLSDDLGSATFLTPGKTLDSARGRDRRPSSPSAQSLFENMTPEEQAEETRRRKRDKLAKLHRFLGSRVPTNLVLGLDNPEQLLSNPGMEPLVASDSEEATRKAWLRRRRSSSATAYPSSWSDDIDRIKEDLNLREKAINVRRAQKMEKVFGIAPPQTLYHTRRSPSPSVANAAAITGQKTSSAWTQPGESLSAVTGILNPNRSSKPRKNKDSRPGTSESNQSLIPKGHHDPGDKDEHRHASLIYTHYQHSLNSLNDIIDRDDKESLAELHEYLSSGDMSIPPPLQTFSLNSPLGSSGERRLSNASSIKSERRRSLPTRTSIISVSSEFSISTPRPDMTDFQARRRRAAKLTQFFGVDYRELISDVLESIENGLEHERKRGTLNPEEVEDLLARLRNLRTKRSGFLSDFL